MCLFIRKSYYKIVKDLPTPIKTNEDIEVWKVLGVDDNNKLCSYVQYFPYKLNVLYKTAFGIRNSVVMYDVSFVNEGFHSYSLLENVPKAKVIIGKLVMVKCTIPKGSKLFISSNEKEIASNQIIIKDTYDYYHFIKTNKLLKIKI